MLPRQLGHERVRVTVVTSLPRRGRSGPVVSLKVVTFRTVNCVNAEVEDAKDCQGLLRPKKTVKVRAAGLWSMILFQIAVVNEEK